MTEIRFESEKELIEGIKQSQVYKEFSSKYLGLKKTNIIVPVFLIAVGYNIYCS
jgi:hypothetical protein